MTDRELLELAAKAIGMNLAPWKPCGGGYYSYAGLGSDERKFWLPLIEGGDSFQMAVSLRLEIYIHEHDTRVVSADLVEVTETHGDNPHAATCRAIVRAAAEIERASQAAEERKS